MKKILVLLVLTFAILSCSKKDESTQQTPDSLQNAVLKYSGTFTPTSGITIAGNAKVYLNGSKYILKLENFSVTSGPDLKVYLSKTDKPETYVSLGALPSATSNIFYTISNPVDFTQYKYVLIHCENQNHLFAVSLLTIVN
jgi:Electron transfer DM13